MCACVLIMDFESITSALQSVTESDVVVELLPDYEEAKPFVTLDDRDRKKFHSKTGRLLLRETVVSFVCLFFFFSLFVSVLGKLQKTVSDGLTSLKKKDSLAFYLQTRSVLVLSLPLSIFVFSFLFFRLISSLLVLVAANALLPRSPVSSWSSLLLPA